MTLSKTSSTTATPTRRVDDSRRNLEHSQRIRCLIRIPAREMSVGPRNIGIGMAPAAAPLDRSPPHSTQHARGQSLAPPVMLWLST
jgi:hypothetical protein